MPLRLVSGEPALFVEGDRGVLAISDLHLGYERALEAKGVHVPEQTKKMTRRVLALREVTGAKRLVILGDIKHDIVGSSFYTAISVGSFFREIGPSFEEVLVVPGNHDGGLSPLLPPSVRLSGPGGLALETSDGKVGFFHGHAHPSKAVSNAKVLVSGHHHLILGGQGGRQGIWVRVTFDPPGHERTLIVMPAFNTLLTGVPASEFNPDRWKPILSELLPGDYRAEAFLMNGSKLGSLTDLAGRLLVDND